MRRRARAGDRNLSVLRRVWALVWSVPGCKGHSYRLPIVSTVSAELAGLVVRLSKFTISPTTPCATKKKHINDVSRGDAARTVECTRATRHAIMVLSPTA